MDRRDFILKSAGLVLTVCVLPSYIPVFKNKMDRIAMGTVLFRYRFKQTKPKEIDSIQNELTLLDVPAFYKKRFGISKLEFWSNHFESLEPSYLKELKQRIKASRAKLVNVQLDSNYDLASKDEQTRVQGVEHVRSWMDAAASLGSTCVRVNPGRANGSVEKSIESMKTVSKYARSKRLVLLTENHFGIEMNTDVHLRINREAGPKIYTLPDFGNYPRNTMYESLEKIMPYAYLISAKADQFNSDLQHVSYDFDRCVQMAEKLGFKGVYALEQWNSKYTDIDYEKVGDWLIERVKNNI